MPTNQSDKDPIQSAYNKPTQSRLAPFAEMVLQSTEVSYRCKVTLLQMLCSSTNFIDPTPTSPRGETNSPTKIKSNEHSAQHRRGSTSIQSNNERAFKSNSSIPQTSSVQPAEVTPTKNTVVLVPNLAEPAKRAEYQAFPSVDHEVVQSRTTTPKKRKRNSDNEVPGISDGVDPREKSKKELEQLRNLLETIFKAEEYNVTVEASGQSIYTQDEVLDSHVQVLTSPLQQRLDFALRKVISDSRISDIPVDQLVHIQSICFPSVRVTENISLAVGQDWNETDTHEWLRRIDSASRGLYAGKTIVRIMATALDEKQVYSEENTSIVLKALRNILDYTIIPVTEARSSGANSESFATFSAEKKTITSLLIHANELLVLIGTFLDKVDVVEELITEIEYITTNLIFVDNAHSERDSVLGIQKFEMLRRTALNVLSTIFLRYPNQRTFIIDEILSSLEKLPITPQSARQYRIADGNPIQLVSALLMRLVQTTTSTVGSVAKMICYKEPGAKIVQNGVQYDAEEESSRDSTPLMTKHHKGFTDENHAVEKVDAFVKILQGAAQQNAQYVMHYLIQRALNSTKSGDQPYRVLLDIFTEDFINCLGLADWPSAELLLRMLLSSLLRLAETDKTPAPQKNMALDLLGIMGSGIIDLNNRVRHLSQGLDASESELADRLIRLANDACEDDLGEEDLLSFDGPYRALLEYLQNYDSTDMQCESARSYHLIQWASRICKAIKNRQQESEDVSNNVGLSNLQYICRQVERVLETSDVSAQ